MTTERKAQLKFDIKAGLKFTAYLYLGVGIVMVCGFFINQESLEKQFPTPHEWSFLTRRAFRNACAARYQTDPEQTVQWGQVINWMRLCRVRLLDAGYDGEGVRPASPDRPQLAMDISAKSEAWRRGYFETMMNMVKGLEEVEGWMVDTTRGIIFPPELVIGPSNPNPKPIPAGFKGAPKEEDCTLAFMSPNEVFLGIIYTIDLSNRQRIEANLAYANWLDFKGLAGPAGIIYEDAVNLAAAEAPPQTLDPETWTINENASLPSANLLTTLTAYAEFRARNGDISSALPIFVSLLKARRNLPADPNTPPRNPAQGIAGILRSLFVPAAYPPPPPDGTAPPVRDPKELCAEAALSLHIGEIIYTSQATNREEGLGWTREAVDIAEEQLHRLNSSEAHKPARASCRECLATGLGNWQNMVARLAREEAARKEEVEAAAAQKPSSWFGLWGGDGGIKKEDLSRWAAEEKVIEERERRAKELLEELEPPPRSALAALFNA